MSVRHKAIVKRLLSARKIFIERKIIMGEEKKIVFQLDDSRTMEISTGKLAGLANGSCLVRMGDSIVLTTACSGAPREGTDFFPLQVDYRENMPLPVSSPAVTSNAKAVPPPRRSSPAV